MPISALPPGEGISVEAELQSWGNRRVDLLSNRGNAGDALIQLSAGILFEKHGIAANLLSKDGAAESDVLVAMGGGGYCRAFRQQATALQKRAAQYGQVILLPASFDPEMPSLAEMFAALPGGSVVYCRERQSLDLLRSLPTTRHLSIRLDHDLALHLEPPPAAGERQGTLMAYRMDEESLFQAWPAGNRDIGYERREKAGRWLLENVAPFREVWTDRAHVAIAAALGGCETHISDNTYHKTLGIAAFSLAHLPNVHLHPQHPVSKLPWWKLRRKNGLPPFPWRTRVQQKASQSAEIFGNAGGTSAARP